MRSASPWSHELCTFRHLSFAPLDGLTVPSWLAPEMVTLYRIGSCHKSEDKPRVVGDIHRTKPIAEHEVSRAAIIILKTENIKLPA